MGMLNVDLKSSPRELFRSILFFDGKSGNTSHTRFWANIASLIVSISYIVACGVMYAIVWWKGKDFPSDEWMWITLTYGGLLITNSIASKLIEHRTKVSLGKAEIETKAKTGNSDKTQEQAQPTQEEQK